MEMPCSKLSPERCTGLWGFRVCAGFLVPRKGPRQDWSTPFLLAIPPGRRLVRGECARLCLQLTGRGNWAGDWGTQWCRCLEGCGMGPGIQQAKCCTGL